MVFPSGLTSKDIHVPSVVLMFIFLPGSRGRPLVVSFLLSKESILASREDIENVKISMIKKFFIFVGLNFLV